MKVKRIACATKAASEVLPSSSAQHQYTNHVDFYNATGGAIICGVGNKLANSKWFAGQWADRAAIQLVDDTTDAQDVGTDDFALATLFDDDGFWVGAHEQFSVVKITVSTAESSGSVSVSSSVSSSPSSSTSPSDSVSDSPSDSASSSASSSPSSSASVSESVSDSPSSSASVSSSTSSSPSSSASTSDSISSSVSSSTSASSSVSSSTSDSVSDSASSSVSPSGSAGTGAPAVWEFTYWNGSSYSALTLLDTPDFTSIGDTYLSFYPPSDWAVISEATNAKYIIRGRATNAPANTAPLATIFTVSDALKISKAVGATSHGTVEIGGLGGRVTSKGDSAVAYFQTANAGNTVTLTHKLSV